MPSFWDLAIFVLTTMMTRLITLPLAHVCGVMIPTAWIDTPTRGTRGSSLVWVLLYQTSTVAERGTKLDFTSQTRFIALRCGLSISGCDSSISNTIYRSQTWFSDLGRDWKVSDSIPMSWMRFKVSDLISMSRMQFADLGHDWSIPITIQKSHNQFACSNVLTASCGRDQ